MTGLKNGLRRIFRPRSVAGRLARGYALAAALVLSVAVVTLAALEDAEIDTYQTNEIKNRFSLFAYDAYHTETLKDWKRLREKYDQIASEAAGRIYIRADSADPAFSIPAPFRIIPRHISKNHGFSKHWIGGNYFRAYSKIIPPRGQRPEMILSLAVDAFYYEDLGQWLDLAFDLFLLVTVVVMALVGALLARRCLRPVDRLSAAAAGITGQNLSARLPAGSLPTELEGLVQTFNGVLDRLEVAHRRQAAFNSDVAHELRTPVGNLIGQSQVALSKPRSAAELENMMVSNLEEMERLRSIINDMLFLSHADQGEISIKKQIISLASETAAAADFFEILLEENHNPLQISGDARVEVEPGLLKRVLYNLFNNALQHGEPGSEISVTVTEEKTPQGRLACFRMTNRGKPIPKADLPFLFDRFYRVEKDRRDSRSHHGLGLSIVKAIIELHGGLVTASSAGGKITIGFDLPVSN